MIKPQTVALAGFGERSVDTTGPAIDTQRLSGPLMVISRIASVEGAGAAVTVRIEDSADGTTFAEVHEFAERAAATDPPDVIALDRVGRYVRAVADVAADPDVVPKIRLEVLGILS